MVRQIDSCKKHLIDLSEQKSLCGGIEAVELELKLYETKLRSVEQEISLIVLNRGQPKLSNDDNKKLVYYEKVVKILQLRIDEGVPNRAVTIIADPSTW